MIEDKICQGPKDPNLYACRHIWREDVEEGCLDNQTYMYCENCGLICPIPKGGEYPPECIEHRMKQSEKKLVNAKDFDDPKHKSCVECQE